VRTLGKRVE